MEKKLKGIALCLMGCLTLGLATPAKAQDLSEYAALASVVQGVIIFDLQQIELAEASGRWLPEKRIQVQREKLYLRTYRTVLEDAQELHTELIAAASSGTANNGHIRGGLEALKGMVSGIDLDRPAAGKTGTTGDQTDPWFVGEDDERSYADNLVNIRSLLVEAIRMLDEISGTCGDGLCQSEENCRSCPADCGSRTDC